MGSLSEDGRAPGPLTDTVFVDISISFPLSSSPLYFLSPQGSKLHLFLDLNLWSWLQP